MDRFTGFKIRLAIIGFVPSLIFACLAVFFIYLYTDLPPFETNSLLVCATFILLVLVPLSIGFDKKWQKPLVDKIHRFYKGHPLSNEEIHRMHEMGLQFPIHTYILNLIWWLVGTLAGCLWFFYMQMPNRDIFYVFTTAMTGGILSALVQFYAVKSFLWKTLPSIVSDTTLNNPKEIKAPLTIRSKLLLSFLSVIFPALIFSGLLAYTAVFKKIRDEDVHHKLFVGQIMVKELAAQLPSLKTKQDFQRFFSEYRREGFQNPVFLYHRNGQPLYSNSTTPLSAEELHSVFDLGADHYFNVGQKGTALCFFVPEGGPLLLLWCPWFLYSDALENIRLMLTLTSLALFISLIIVIYLASYDIAEPLQSLKNKAGKIARGKLDVEVEVFSDDEVGELAWSLREMTNRLKESNRSLEFKVKERTQSLENAYKELCRLNTMKDEFLSSVSHELRTPLTSIRSFSEILISYPNENEQTRMEFLSIINTETERLTRLVNELLDLAKIESGKTVWKKEKVEILPVLRAVARTFKVVTEGKNLTFDVNAPADLPCLWVDRDRLIQVLSNLVSNAIKFTHPGGIIRMTAERLDGRRIVDRGKMIKFCVSDTGEGIPEEEHEKIFEKFVQSWNPFQNKPKGTGLGLSICKEIILHYGGNIWAESSPGIGTRMYFILPCEPDLKEEAQAGDPDEDWDSDRFTHRITAAQAGQTKGGF